MGHNSQPWPKEREQQLRDLYVMRQDDKYFLSIGYIAAQMGVRKASVIGKLHRMGLERDPTVPYITMQGVVINPTVTTFVKKSTPEKPSTVSKISYYNNDKLSKTTKPVKFDKGPGEFVGETTLTACQISGLTKSTCRFPIGHVGKEGFHFCGGATTKGKPYCDYHAHICYTPARPSVKKVPIWR